jgi:hypothetical protein
MTGRFWGYLIHSISRTRSPSNSFTKPNKPDKRQHQKEGCRLISFTNIDANILNKRLAN